jgi:hypothetical protein
MLEYKYSAQPGSLQAGATAAAPHAPASVSLDGIPRDVIRLVPAAVAHTHTVLPIAIHGETLMLATDRPGDVPLRDKLTFLLNRKIVLTFAPRRPLLVAIARYYGVWAAADSIVAFAEAEEDEEFELSLEDGPRRAERPKSLATSQKYMAGTVDLMKEIKTESIPGEDATQPIGGSGMFFHVVEEGQRSLVRYYDGTMEIIVGPRRIWRVWRDFQPMQHFIAHPGEFLIVRYRDGRQEHLVGPTEIWLDPRVHQEIKREEALQLSAKEAVVVYSMKPDGAIGRRIVNGPAQFVPQPGEWLHTFTWHASQGGHLGAVKIPKGLVFQKLWLMPDQMYHDVADVRTADDAVLTIRLMIFFELINIERLLETSHDPIGDFVNAATSDVVAFVGRYDFEAFKRNVTQLNELDTYRQLSSRAEQCGYRINKVVYRGYGAPDALQKMHDEAIEARTKLQLQRATEEQAQDLENYKLDCQITRAVKRREEQSAELAHDLAMVRQRHQAELEQRENLQASAREQGRLQAEMQLAMREKQDAQARAHLSALRSLEVDLTAYLTQARADRVIELRGAASGTHVHLEASPDGEKSAPKK